jgi:hypothetical protein
MNIRTRGLIILLGAMIISSCAGMPQLDSFAQIEGVLTAMGTDQWTVNGIDVLLTDETEIKGEFRLGDTVKIEVEMDEGGSPIAFEIDLVHDTDEFEFFGIVEEITDELWVIGEHSVLITPFTEIKGPIVVGDMVKVHASFNAEGELVAREIELPEQDEHQEDDEVEFVGVVETQSEDGWWIDGQFVQISDQTEIEDDIAEGDLVKVEALRNDDGSLLALEIELEDDDLDVDCDDDGSEHDDSSDLCDDDHDIDDEHDDEEDDDEHDEHHDEDDDDDDDDEHDEGDDD